MRTVAAIRHDLNAAQGRVAKLQAELRRALAADRTARDREIVRAFTAGERVKDIAKRLGLTLNATYGVLYRHDLSTRERVTPINHLPPEVQREYEKLRRNGHGPGAARAIAQAVTT